MAILASEYQARTGRLITVAGSIGSSGGMLALEDGVISAAMISREPRPQERARWRVLPVARTKVALAANLATPVDSLTQAQVTQVFRGDSGLGLAPLLREEGDSGTAIFCQANPLAARGIMEPGRRLPVAFTDQEMERLLESRPGAVGILDEGLVGLNRHRLKTITLTDGGGPTHRTLHLLYPATPGADLEGFLGFLTSPEGAAIIRASGYEVP
jgi:ABC-type phosphate transport system substrate-binding protein